MALLAVNAPIRVEKTRTAALPITAMTKANPGVATSAGHGLSNGDVVVFSIAGGMVELNEQAVRVANVTTDDYELEGLDTTNMTDWTAGDAFGITAWHTLCNATGVDLPNNEPTKVTTTNLCSTQEESSIGLPGEVSGSVPVQDDAANEGLRAITNLAAGGTIVFKQTWGTGEEKVFNGQAVYGYGYSANVGEVVKGNVSVTLRKRIMAYAAP